eukprot:CAMPEP_0182416564 /NCGR_PEP_ID=MMETSP1167-20130531/911_1 /TAXON_ID=2988 /ORGANISM="Mallomonas Sp, Strain CCMP3275" /LENGTH=93 /DNA_ID=CAMNT_0024589459 /DNA_START=59 /DNA_END=343 /DNA_ORIENTATION=+
MRATVIRLAERIDIHPALKKMWKKHYKVDGLVTQHLSPFEQNIVSPMLYDARSKITKKLQEWLFEIGPAFITAVTIYYWADWKYKQLAYHHRD